MLALALIVWLICIYVCMYDDNLFLQDSADRIRELRRALEELRYEKEICDAKIVRTEALEVRFSVSQTRIDTYIHHTYVHTYIHTYIYCSHSVSLNLNE